MPGPAEVLSPANPAAATNLDFTFADDYDLRGFSMQLLTSATVANRRFKWQIEDASGNVVARGVAAVDQTASLTWQHFATPGAPSQAAVQNLWLGTNFPGVGVPVSAGWHLKTNIDALSAGDQLSAIRLLVQNPARGL